MAPAPSRSGTGWDPEHEREEHMVADKTRPSGTRTPRRPSRTPRGPSRWTVRTRVLSTLLVFIAGGLAVTGVLTFAAQFRALDQRVEAEIGRAHV